MNAYKSGQIGRRPDTACSVAISWSRSTSIRLLADVRPRLSTLLADSTTDGAFTSEIEEEFDEDFLAFLEILTQLEQWLV